MLSLIGIGLTLGGIFFAPLLAISFFASAAGFISSAIGLSEIKKNPGQYTNKNKAMAGLIISIISVALTILFVFLLFLFAYISLIGYLVR